MRRPAKDVLPTANTLPQRGLSSATNTTLRDDDDGRLLARHPEDAQWQPGIRQPKSGVWGHLHGTLLVSFIVQVNYTDGVYRREDMVPTPLYLARSDDQGQSWTCELAKVGRMNSPSVHHLARCSPAPTVGS